MNELKFTITNLTCEACAKVSCMALRTLNGIRDVTVDFQSGAARIKSDEPVNSEDIMKMLNSKGYNVLF